MKPDLACALDHTNMVGVITAILVIGLSVMCGSIRFDSENAVATTSENCDPSYPDVCIEPSPPDLDCGDVPYTDIKVAGNDPHKFDREGDGIGCES